jgi:type IV secretion system protein TrbL
MRRRAQQFAPLLAVVVLVCLFNTAYTPAAQADTCNAIPSIPLVPNPVKTGCEVILHPKKTAEKTANAVAEAVTHPGNTAKSVLTAPLRAAGDEVMQGVTSWVANGASWLVSQAGKLMNETTTPRVESPWFLQEYTAMVGLAALFALPLLLLATIQGVLRRDGAMIVRAAFVQLPLAFFLTGMAITVVQVLLALTDQMSSQIGATVGSDEKTFLASVAKALITVATATAGGNPVPLFAACLAAFVAAVGAFFVWVELLIRSAGVYVAMLFLPTTFIAMIWEKTAHWCRRLVESLFAIIFSKFVIVAIMVLAAAGLSQSRSSEAFQGVLAGIALLLLAAFSPLALLRLIPFVASAAHTSWRSGAGSQTLGSVAGPAAVMRRVTDANWGSMASGGLQAAPALAGAAAGIGAAEALGHGAWTRAENIGGAAGRGDSGGNGASTPSAAPASGGTSASRSDSSGQGPSPTSSGTPPSEPEQRASSSAPSPDRQTGGSASGGSSPARPASGGESSAEPPRAPRRPDGESGAS